MVEHVEIGRKKWRAPSPPSSLRPRDSDRIGNENRFVDGDSTTVWGRSYDGSAIVGLSKVRTIRNYNDSVSSSSTTIASSASFNAIESLMNNNVSRISSTGNSVNSDEEFNSEIKVSEARIDLSPEQSESEYSSSIGSYHSPNSAYNVKSCPRRPPHSKTFADNHRDELLRKAADAGRNRNYAPLISGVGSPVTVKRLSNFTLTPSRWIPPIPVSSFGGDKIEEIYADDVVSRKSENARRNGSPLSPARSTIGSNNENTAPVGGREAEKSESVEKILHLQLTELMEMLAEWQQDNETVDDIRLKKRLIEKRQQCFELWQKHKRQANPLLEWKTIREQWSDERSNRKTSPKMGGGEATPSKPKAEGNQWIASQAPVAYLDGRETSPSGNSGSDGSVDKCNMRGDRSRASSLSLSQNSTTVLAVGESRESSSPTIPNSRHPSSDRSWQASNPPVRRPQQPPVAPPMSQEFLSATKTPTSNIHKERASASKRSTYTSHVDDNSPTAYSEAAHSATNKQMNGTKIYQENVLFDPRDTLMAEIRCAGGASFLRRKEATTEWNTLRH